MPKARPGDLALPVLLLCQDAPPLEREGRAMEFGAQDKAGVLHPGVPEGERTVRFALRIVARPAADGGVDFAGPFVHGVPQGRFLYLGYRPLGETIWTRRWKLPLAALTLSQALAAHEDGKEIMGRVSAGSTSTVRLLGLGWSVTGGSAQETVSGAD
jgi:Family of unknown function (DUF5990)